MHFTYNNFIKNRNVHFRLNEIWFPRSIQYYIMNLLFKKKNKNKWDAFGEIIKEDCKSDQKLF